MPLYDARVVNLVQVPKRFIQPRILLQVSRQMEAFSLVINGESHTFRSPLSVSGLLEALGHAGKRVAVERNGEIIPRSRHGEAMLENGDKLEIVVAVGGG